MSEQYLPLDALDARQHARVREIYDEAFPPALSAPFEDLLVDRMLVFVDTGDVEDGAAGARAAEVLGLALVRDLGAPDADTGWTFLRYFAASSRGGGVGSRMFRGLTALLRAEGRTLLAWDVEDPDAPGIPVEEIAMNRRRLGFYERNGGVLQPLREYRPPHEDGHEPALRLMATPLVSDLPPARELLLGVMQWRYGCGADHPNVRHTLEVSGI